ncbi:tRNA pseudouridine(55) synthase TruB [Legionella bononiensis]|uniref:tRNA pseudouridine synthase B n=1 Tax=Legionella bononiensis TaxID=2793102 RepID=A0ABS1WGA1_9GAMM|nr:tRNA pseudouridine(55) synthase TruB [Legionella bononiensis]MBL7481827.1 tRNA pseudouridine(55) synthase TruB [Legionella bononiensis]MBL7528376.1 tRNA pseudouridine(55) synthase TruB [Legionella bononiensis]MBL7564339.1 tRNA pseudouridine(55) synthase TruB [Legionella bononiensis]
MKATDTSTSINGIFLLNKPEGITSNSALQKVKRLFGAKKAGHTGSLDPLATGMLPICFGEATKICQYLLDADKCYETTGLLGIKTNTSDSMGQVVAQVDDFCITEGQLSTILLQYTGAIRQIPSMFSALKHKGTPLYRFAREGIEIERQPRDIIINQLQLNSFNGTQFSLTVHCSKGTYIRNLVEDIGDSLKVGAHVTRLHRLYTSGFQNMPMYSIDDLQAMSPKEQHDCLIPMDTAIDYLKSITLSDDEVIIIRQGRVIVNKMDVDRVDCVRLYDERAQFIGLGEQLANGDIKAKRLLSFPS